MAKIEPNYKVLPGKSITGKHRVYTAGEFVPASEMCGDLAEAVESGIVEKIEVEDLAAAKELAEEEKKPAKKPGPGRARREAE